MAQKKIVFYGFTTVENPLSNGGKFTIGPTYSALKVTALGVCEATVTSTNCLMYWSGAVPSGDTGGTFPADQYAEVAVSAYDNTLSDNLYCIVRQDAATTDHYLSNISGILGNGQPVTVLLYATASGTTHALATFTNCITALYAGDIFRLQVDTVGGHPVLTCYQNGTQVCTFTDTNNYVTGPGFPCLGLYAGTSLASPTISSFSAGAAQAATPTFSPATATSSQTVTVTSASGGTIYYTTDGSTPTRSSSSVASGATVSVTAPATLKAIASASGFVDSGIQLGYFGPVVISALTYAVTDTTIEAEWTTDVSVDSNLFAGGKAAIDNGVAAYGTSHKAIVTGLLPNTVYSCHVTSGAVSSSNSNQTTAAAPARLLATSATNVFVTSNGLQGDTMRSFVSNDNNTYMTQDDATGFVLATPNAGYNTQLGLITNESSMYGTFISLANYGTPGNVSTGTDGPSNSSLTNKSTGLIGMNGNLHLFVYRQHPPSYDTNRFANWIKSTNHGSTWNNFNDSTLLAGGNPLSPNSAGTPLQFYNKFVGLIAPVLYAPDDGTLGYRTAGNLIDGANAYVYMNFAKDNATGTMYLMRIPRIQFDAQNAAAIQYWIGPGNPAVADFTNDVNWSNTEGSETIVLTPAAPFWAQICFIPKLNTYLVFGHTKTGDLLHNVLLCYSAPTPAGPWTLVLSQNQAANGDSYGFFPFHREVASNTVLVNVSFRVMQTRNDNYQPAWSTFTITATAPVSSGASGGSGAVGQNLIGESNALGVRRFS